MLLYATRYRSSNVCRNLCDLCAISFYEYLNRLYVDTVQELNNERSQQQTTVPEVSQTSGGTQPTLSQSFTGLSTSNRPIFKVPRHQAPSAPAFSLAPDSTSGANKPKTGTANIPADVQDKLQYSHPRLQHLPKDTTISLAQQTSSQEPSLWLHPLVEKTVRHPQAHQFEVLQPTLWARQHGITNWPTDLGKVAHNTQAQKPTASFYPNIDINTFHQCPTTSGTGATLATHISQVNNTLWGPFPSWRQRDTSAAQSALLSYETAAVAKPEPTSQASSSKPTVQTSEGHSQPLTQPQLNSQSMTDNRSWATVARQATELVNQTSLFSTPMQNVQINTASKTSVTDCSVSTAPMGIRAQAESTAGHRSFGAIGHHTTPTVKFSDESSKELARLLGISQETPTTHQKTEEATHTHTPTHTDPQVENFEQNTPATMPEPSEDKDLHVTTASDDETSDISGDESTQKADEWITMGRKNRSSCKRDVNVTYKRRDKPR